MPQLSSLVDSWVHAGPYPGAVVGIFDADGKELYHHVVNKKDSLQDFKRDTIFRLYSMSKPFTATLFMILVERGVIRLEDEVSKFIPAFKDTPVITGGNEKGYTTEQLSVPLTIKHVLTHASGLPSVFFGRKPVEKIMQKRFKAHFLTGYKGFSNEEIAETLAQGPLMFQPGTAFEYGLNYELLGHIMEVATGKPLTQLFQEEIFGPLKLVDTDFYVPPEKMHRLGTFYRIKEGHLPEHATAEEWPEVSRDHIPRFLSGGSGLNGTLDDFSRFARMLMNGGELDGVRILSPESVAAMTQNQLLGNADVADLTTDRGLYEIDAGGFGYGYGVSVVRDPAAGLGCQLSSPGEYGWGGLSSTFFYVDPVRKYTMIVMTCLMPSNKYPFRAQLRYMSHWAMQGEK